MTEAVAPGLVAKEESVMKTYGVAIAATLLAAGPLLAQEPVQSGRDTLRPYTVAPQLQNSSEIARLLEDQYPPGLQDRGVTGTVVLLVQVGTEGQVRRAAVWESSGHAEFDDVATAVASSMRFVAAQSPSGPVAVQIMVPVDFKLRQDAPAAPQLTSYDVKPALLNATEANRVVDVLYPPQLRASKIGGRTVLWVYVGLDGHVEVVRVMESSGYEEFDRAAGLASRVMEFSPAQEEGEAVAVWNETTVTFLPDGRSTIRP